MAFVSHLLCLGVTGSGKSTFGRAYLDAQRSSGIRSAVLDITRGEWGADFQTHDPDRFLAWCYAPKPPGERWALYLDEGGASVPKGDKRWDFLFTTGRHCGYVVHYFSQYYSHCSTVVRSQCRRRVVFQCDEAPLLAKAWNRPEIADAGHLAPFHFFYLPPFGATMAGVITMKRNKPRVEFRPLANAPLPARR